MDSRYEYGSNILCNPEEFYKVMQFTVSSTAMIIRYLREIFVGLILQVQLHRGVRMKLQ